MSDQWARQALIATKGLRVVYTLYPVIGVLGAGAAVPAGTVLANAGAANTFGANTELIAAAAIAAPFWFCQLQIGAVSVAENFVGQINRGAAVTVIYEFRCSATLVTGNMSPFTPVYPIYVGSGTQVTGRCASVSGADTVTASILVATGL
jgi:hypothetical protein